MPDDETSFELPEQQKKRMLEAEKDLKQAKDLAEKLRAAGEPHPDLETKIDDLEARVRRFKEAFNVE